MKSLYQKRCTECSAQVHFQNWEPITAQNQKKAQETKQKTHTTTTPKKPTKQKNPKTSFITLFRMYFT